MLPNKAIFDKNQDVLLLIFGGGTGKQGHFHLNGFLEEVFRGRPGSEQVRRGHRRLHVVAREVTLLPRQCY